MYGLQLHSSATAAVVPLLKDGPPTALVLLAHGKVDRVLGYVDSLMWRGSGVLGTMRGYPFVHHVSRYPLKRVSVANTEQTIQQLDESIAPHI